MLAKKNSALVLLRSVFRTWKSFFKHDWAEEFEGIKNLQRLLAYAVSCKTVVIVEPNEFHGETIPGHCRYFQELGYTVLVLLRRKNLSGGIFCRYPDESMPQFFCLGPWGMKFFLNSRNVKQFDVVFLNSNFYAVRDIFWGRYQDYLKSAPKGKYGWLAVEHCFQNLLPYVKEGTVDFGRLFQLSEYRYGTTPIPMLNAHYFGPYAVQALTNARTFITVGAVHPQQRNMPQLVSVVQGLVRRGISNFRILVIGRVDPSVDVSGMPEQIVFLGPLSFPDMYDKMDEANFLLPLLDPSMEAHRRYLDGQTTGSRQLILGFAKIPVLHDEFADAYAFTQANAIRHADGGLEAAMERAIGMTQPEYDAMRRSLEELAQTVYEKSLLNLKNTLGAVMHGH